MSASYPLLDVRRHLGVRRDGRLGEVLGVQGHPGAVSDEFVEGIVDDQARNYTKRVLASFFTYGWLEDASVPPMPNKIPRDAWPK